MAALTSEHKSKIVQALGALEEAKKEAARARVAGIELGDRLAEIDNLSTKLRQIHSAYWPGGKPVK